MRARNIKPGFYENEVLGTMSPLAHLLFPYLWMECDWEGRMEYRPVKLKARAFPYRDADIDKLCDELEAGNLIVRYGHPSCEHWILSVKNFTKHQNPCKKERETPSKLPGMDSVSFKYDPSTVPVPYKNGTGTGSVPLITDYLILNTDIPVSVETESASPPLVPEKEKPKQDPNVKLILDAYSKATSTRTDWDPQPKPPGNKDTRKLLSLRASEPDFVAGLDRYVELVTALDWAEAKDIVFFLRRKTFDNCMSGEWGPSKKSNGKFQKSPDPAPISDPAMEMKKNKMYADLQEKADARKSAGTDLF
jgi:hypothetical protein